MKLVTRDTDYAVRALCYIAGKKRGLVSVTELVQELKIPRPFLRKILQVLGRSGIVRSTKGVGGGFELGLPVSKIKLSRLIEIFQGKAEMSNCLFKKKMCPDSSTCPLRKKIDGIGRYVNSQLDGITIGSLLK